MIKTGYNFVVNKYWQNCVFVNSISISKLNLHFRSEGIHHQSDGHHEIFQIVTWSNVKTNPVRPDILKTSVNYNVFIYFRDLLYSETVQYACK